jgi:hypothetical protein
MLNLQVVPNADGTKPPVPNTTKIAVWPGLPGMSAVHTLSSNVGVVFLNGDFSQPRVVDFDGTLPQELTLDATSKLHLGPTATSVDLAGGGTPVHLQGGAVYVVGAFSGVVSGVPATGVVTGLGVSLDGSGKVSSG